MKTILILSALIFFIQMPSYAQDIFELYPTQSMIISGKGSGQDAVINPYLNEDSYAIVKNIGKKEFSIRIQSKGKIIETIDVLPNTSKAVKLLKDYDLYLDTEYKTKASVEIQKKE